MTSTKKDKFKPSPSTKTISGQRRHHAHQVGNMKPVSVSVPTTPLIDRVSRPKRWRKRAGKIEGDCPVTSPIPEPLKDSPLAAEQDSHSQHQSGIEVHIPFVSKKSDEKDEDEEKLCVQGLISQKTSGQQRQLPANQDLRAQQKDGVELRFSFSNEKEDEDEEESQVESFSQKTSIHQLFRMDRPRSTASHPQLPVRASGRPADSPALLPFSSLIIPKKREDYGLSYLEFPVNQSLDEDESTTPTIVSTPKKKREGYGFSYSEYPFNQSFASQDSIEYPDTICDDLSYQNDIPNTPRQEEEDSIFTNTTQPPVIKLDSSFNEVVVLRPPGSFHVAKPERPLTCTSATREDTIRLKARAKALSKYTESVDIYGELITRLEKMVREGIAVAKPNTKGDVMVTAITNQCAMKLRDFLKKIKEERVEMGDDRNYVEHEIEWAMWLVEASHCGVMHLKTPDCMCKPDWEE